MKTQNFLVLAVLVLLFFACGNSNKSAKQSSTPTSKPIVTFNAPSFNSDSAYLFVKKQVDFGPRVPNSAEHKACANYLAKQLKTFGASVELQEGKVKGFKTTYNMINIAGSFQPEATNRILLCAHWDSRYVADYDSDESKHFEPILGANDGASGVGVLLEIARLIQFKQPNIGVDIVFFDIEDQGIPRFDPARGTQDFWCLGSKYWAKEAAKSGYKAKYGILLDMVGAPDAKFYQEQYSLKYASFIVNKVWDIAAKSGYSNYFINKRGGLITDDHLPINEILNIPCIDIIQHDEHSHTGFGYYWHTHMDNMDAIDKNTLKAVGQTVANVIYNE